MSRRSESLIGLAYSTAAFVFWGLVPIYWRWLRHVAPLESALHRIVWSAALLAAVLAGLGRLGEVLRTAAKGKLAATLVATALLIGSNWLLFVWAVNSGHLLETSLGYFLTPLINVLLGVIFLKERLFKPQIVAVALAAAGLLSLLWSHGTVPWIALSIAVTFGFYGLLRKTAPVDALLGLAVETMLLAVPASAALFYLGAAGRLAFLRDAATTSLLLGTALVTTIPLYWFAQATKRLDLKTVAFTQYLSPTGHFLLALFLFGEPLGAAQTRAFVMIWVALAVYSADAALRYRRREPQPLPD